MELPLFHKVPENAGLRRAEISITYAAVNNGLKTEPNKIVLRRAVIGREYEKEIFIRRGYDDQASVSQTTATISPADIGSVTKWEVSRRRAEQILLEEVHATLRFRIPPDMEDKPRSEGSVELRYPGEKGRTREQRIPIILFKAPIRHPSPPSLYFDVSAGRTRGSIRIVSEGDESVDSVNVASVRIERFPRCFSIETRPGTSNAIDVSLSTHSVKAQWLDDSLLVTADDGTSFTIPIIVKNASQ